MTQQIGVPAQQIVIRLDGLSGNAAPLGDVLTSGLAVVARHKEYHVLDVAVVQAVLTDAPAATCTPPLHRKLSMECFCLLSFSCGGFSLISLLRLPRCASRGRGIQQL